MGKIDPAMTNPSTVSEHSIAVVEGRTGVSQDVLRAWERRYATVTPARSETGQRLYSDADIERIRLVRAAIMAGRRVSQVSSLSSEELLEITRRDASETAAPTYTAKPGAVPGDVDSHLRACLHAVERMNSTATHALLMRAAATLGVREFVDGVAVPLLRSVGASWEKGALRPTHEHVLSVALRRVLSWLLDALPASPEAPLVMFCTLPNQRHEFGAMLAAVVAASRQCRVSYLGPDLPPDDIAHAALQASADVVAVSMLEPVDFNSVRRGLEQLRSSLPHSVDLIAGGHAAIAHAHALATIGVTVLRDLDGWDSWLATR